MSSAVNIMERDGWKMIWASSDTANDLRHLRSKAELKNEAGTSEAVVIDTGHGFALMVRKVTA